MSPEMLIRARHALWMGRVKEYNRAANAGEPDGLESWDDLARQAVAVIQELEHIAGALGITIDEPIYG
jgi:broad specificity phosphatase PhoE